MAATPAEPGCKTAGEAAAKLTETGNSAAGSGTIEHTANGNSIIGSDYIIGSDNGSDYLDRQLAELKHDYVAAQNTTDPGAAHFDKAAQDFPSGHHFAAAEQQVPNGRLSPAPKVGVAAADFTAAEFAAVGFASASLTSSASLANANSPTNALGADGAALALEPPVVSGPLDGLIYATVKRLLDLVISLAMLVLLSPLLLLTAILVKLTDGGPVFYPHVRIGEGGNEFTCYKFRSMVVNAEKMKANLAFYNSHDDHKTFKIPNDPRVTWIGRWMRRASIDELPQLLNVLRGEMSVVGPRPPVVSEVEKYTWDDMQRLTVKPGLTCIWQVSGRSRLPFPEQLKMDLQYIENRSLALDLKLILLTVPAVLSADGAY